MSNKNLFIESYLKRLGIKFEISLDDAFEIFSIAAILDMPFQEVYDNVIIQGTMDGGIDGVYFSEQGDQYIMYVFQCKNSTGLQQKQIDKFRNDFRDIFIDGNRLNKPNLKHLKPKMDEYQDISNSGYFIQPRLFFLFNGLVDDPAKGANKQIYDAYHDLDDGFEIWDSKAIYSKIGSLVIAQSRRTDISFTFNPESSNVVLKDNQGLYSYSIQNVTATNFRIQASELCKLVELELKANSTYDYLFAENIRGFLGMRARANQRMAQTLNSPDSVYFPFMNNGITFICDEMTLPAGPQGGNYIVPTKNPVIVNGLQTTRVLYSKYKENPSSIDNVFVNVRIYQTSNPDLIDKITDATNTQTPINFRDKVSTKDFNAWTKELFELNDIAYLTKRGETFANKLSRELKDTVQSNTVLKFWFATYYEKPDIAKNSISQVLETIFDAANGANPLSKLFGGSKDSPVYLQMLRAYKIYTFVQTSLKGYLKSPSKDTTVDKGKLKQQFSNFDELACYGIYKRLEHNLSLVDDLDQIREAYLHATRVIVDICQEESNLHKQLNRPFSPSNYFKKPKSKVDYNRNQNILEGNLIEELLTK